MATKKELQLYLGAATFNEISKTVLCEVVAGTAFASDVRGPMFYQYLFFSKMLKISFSVLFSV